MLSAPTCGRSECQEAEYHANKARNAPKKRKKPVNVCPNCLQPDPKNDHYDSLEGNLGGYTCAQAAPKERHLEPKEGARKADGTVWTKQPGGVEKLEIRNGPNDPWFNNELQFARLIFAFMELQSTDEGAWYLLTQDMAKSMGLNDNQLTSIFMRASDVLRKAGYRE